VYTCDNVAIAGAGDLPADALHRATDKQALRVPPLRLSTFDGGDAGARLALTGEEITVLLDELKPPIWDDRNGH